MRQSWSSDKDAKRHYVPPPDAVFRTRFRRLYELIWEAESRFDLLFREDSGVFVWAANRARLFYDLTIATEIYDAQKARQAIAPEAPFAPMLLSELPQVDAYVHSGALGPAAANRARPWGCTYTQDFVRALLQKGKRVLLLHDAREELKKHPGLFVIHSRQLAGFSAQCRAGFPRRDECVLDDEATTFWARVDNFFAESLDVRILTREKVEDFLFRFKCRLVAQRTVFRQCRPSAFICMAHYFRAPEIQAASEVGARTVDYQHGVNSKYHLGYGFSHLAPDARKVPYYPEEFWTWGAFWASPSWFPSACCDARVIGHQAQIEYGCEKRKADKDPKQFLVATSWAMQSAFRALVEKLAQRLPDWRIIVKLHPRENTSDYSRLAAAYDQVTVLPGEHDIMEAAERATFILSICSSSLFDVRFEGCKLIVVEAEGAEYVEDFVLAYDVPVLKPDAGNLMDCLARARNQSISMDDLIAKDRETRIDIALDSVLGDAFPPSPRRQAMRAPRRHFYLDRRLSIIAENARNSPWCKKYLAAKYGIGIRKDLSPQDISLKRTPVPLWLQPYWSFLVRRLQADEPEIWFRYLKRTAALAEAVGNDELFVDVAADLLKLSAPLAPLRIKVLDAIGRLEAKGHTKLIKKALRALVTAALRDGPTLALIVYESSLRYGLHQPILERFGVRKSSRRWREGVDLLAAQNPTLSRLVKNMELLVERAKGELLDARVSSRDQRALRELIGGRIRLGAPFAMVRLGDGEVYGFAPGYVEHDVLQADRASREGIWWGEELDETPRARLRDEFGEALLSCDVLGLPSAFRLLRDLPPFLDQMRRPIEYWHRTPRAHAILFRELSALADGGSLDMSRVLIVDERCHQQLFTPESTVGLLQGADRVVSVSCFEKEVLGRALRGVRIDDQVLLPPHSNVRHAVPESRRKNLLTPEVLDELYARIDSVVEPGTVVLVAGGFVGKLLIARSKQRGGIALDIGASADYWVGLKTRSRFDFAHYRDRDRSK